MKAFSDQASLLIQPCGLIDPVVSLHAGQIIIKELLPLSVDASLDTWPHWSGVMELVFLHIPRQSQTSPFAFIHADNTFQNVSTAFTVAKICLTLKLVCWILQQGFSPLTVIQAYEVGNGELC